MARHPKFCPECKKLIKPEERHSGKRFHKLCAQRRRARTYPQRHRLAVLAYQRRHRKWVYVPVAQEKRSRVGYAGNTTGWSGSGKDNIG